MSDLQSHYRINIAKLDGGYRTGGGQQVDTYKHHFAIDIIHKDKAKEVFAEITKSYPEPDYNISVTYWDIGGREIDWKE
jgi:hypothetical protein